MATSGARTQHRIPLAVNLSTRGPTAAQVAALLPGVTDARLFNMYTEKTVNGTMVAIKRPGVTVQSSGHTGVGNGLYSFQNSLYAVWGTTLESEAVGTIGTVDGSNSYKFTVQEGGTTKLFFHNTIKGYVYDPVNGLVNVTDTNFNSLSLAKGCAYLDGTMYVMDSLGTIWGSALGDATVWPVLNFVKAQIEPDGGVCLAKQQSFVVAFKQWTTEFFYDAGNATGSPLSPYPGAKLDVGCAWADSIQTIENSILFIGVSRIVTPGVYLVQNLQLTKVSTADVDRLLAIYTYSNSIRSWQAMSNGHVFYGITIPNLNAALVYDLQAQQWAEWSFPGAVSYSFVSSSFVTGASSTSQNVPAYTALQTASQGILAALSPTTYTDTISGQPIVCDIYTDTFDGGTRYKKTLARTELIADQYQGSSVQVRVSDDDYKTWSNFRALDLSKKRAFLTGCGTFRKRAWHLRHTANTPLRLEALELEMILGTA